MLVNVFIVRLWCFYDMCRIIASFSGVQLAGSNQTRAIFERLHREAGRRHAAAQHRHDQNEGTRTRDMHMQESRYYVSDQRCLAVF